MRPIPQRRGTGTLHMHTHVKKDQEVIHQETSGMPLSFDVEPGEAQVSVTHGKKEWRSYSIDGLTVESTCTVHLSCKQTLADLSRANDAASELAWAYMNRNFQRVEADMKEFTKRQPR